jgi:hypothetical protein
VLGDTTLYEEIRDAAETDSGEYLAVGMRDWDHDQDIWNDDPWVVKLGSQGNVEWEATYGSDTREDEAMGVSRKPDGGFLIAGQISASVARPNFSLIRTWPEGWTEAVSEPLSPVEFELKQNYPNPFNASTRIEFSLPQTANIELSIFDLLGREVRTLAHGTFAAGRYRVPVNADDLASGVYVYRLSVNGVSQSKKMLLLK